MAERQRLQARAIVGAIVLVPAIQPGQRPRIGHRRPEVEAVRHGRRRKIIAARKRVIGLRSARGQHPIRGPRWSRALIKASDLGLLQGIVATAASLPVHSQLETLLRTLAG